jgi:arylsulfatase A-like enzyme
VLLAACAEGPYRPDVVILSIDSLSRGALSGYGGEDANAPTLERLASRSLRFANAYSTASWTLPAHASLLTGLDPDRHGATDPRVLLAAELPRLAPHLRKAGYAIVAFTDGAYLDWRYGFGPGFERYDDFVEPPGPGIEVPRGGLPHEEKGTALFDRAITYLEARAADERPLFLFLHTYSVHDYFRLHAWATARAPAGALRDTSGYLRCLLGLEACSDRDWEVLRTLYAAEVAHLDRAEVAGVPRYAMERYHLWHEGVRKNSPGVQPSPLSVAVIQGRDWYIRAPFSEELYDMETDPEQHVDLSADEQRVAGLRELSSVRRATQIQREQLEQDPVLLEQLRALGYVE